MANLKQCGMGCYLCYKEDALGTLYQHWANQTPANAVMFMQPTKDVAAFKFTQNSGRVEMSQNVNKGSQYITVVARFIKELSGAKYKADKITILSHTAIMPLQIIFLKKNSNQVFYLKETGKSILFNGSEISAIGVVNYNETNFLVQTMEYNLFITKCQKNGAAAVTSG